MTSTLCISVKKKKSLQCQFYSKMCSVSVAKDIVPTCQLARGVKRESKHCDRWAFCVKVSQIASENSVHQLTNKNVFAIPNLYFFCLILFSAPLRNYEAISSWMDLNFCLKLHSFLSFNFLFVHFERPFSVWSYSHQLGSVIHFSQ